jgi:hypothetical protein
MNTSRILLCAAIATTSACKIQIEPPLEGGVTTTSTAIECAAGQVCSVDVSDIYFNETFEADPAEGWHFAGWKKRGAGLCGGNTTPCTINTTGWGGNPTLEGWLADPTLITYLEPEFAVDRTTHGITLAGEQNQTQFGLDFDFDFYRNNAYNCGLSGNYTFMVVNPVDGDETDEAPLWVYLHGGGAGFYDENGDYQAVGDQTEDTWNREETFNDFLITQLQGRTVQNGQLKDITLTRRIQEGYRVVMVSMCDHDQYSGLGTPYPNNPNPGAEVNGMQATMSAVEYTVANYPTTEVFAHGTSAGSVGVYNLAMSFAAQDIHLTGVVADSILSPRAFDLFDAYPGQAPRQPGWTYEGVGEKQGFYGDINRSDVIAPEGRIDAGFDEVPLLFVGGTDDPFCFWDLPPIPEAATAGLNNCEWAAQGLIDTIAAQPDSPHQVSNLVGLGHVPTNEVTVANDLVNTFIGDILAGNPDLPFRHIPGYNMMMMGHSFFRPMAEQMPFHAVRSGVAGHTQTVEFSGGASGAPLALWNDAGHRANVQAVLDTGTVELFGMTYEPTSPTTEGYELWFDYALSKNPDTKFFIGLPWADFPSSYADAATYANFWQSSHDGSWHDFIDVLRGLYPDVEIYCIPYGQAALELRTLLEAGNLPDISVLTGVAGDGLFRDNKGHGHEEEILYDTAELVWLNAIYGVELDEYAYDPDYITDIKAIAKSIMDGHDPAYNKK